MKSIPLTQGQTALVDDEDFEELSQYKWFAQKSLNTFYAGRQNKGVLEIMHRVITNAPKGMEVDHLNGNGLDNRRENLRLCTHKENLRNTKTYSTNKLGVKGVYLTKGSYRANITINGKSKLIGYYKTLEEASSAYQERALKEFGVNTRT